MIHNDKFSVSMSKIGNKFVFKAAVIDLLKKIAKETFVLNLRNRTLPQNSKEMETFIKNNVNKWLKEL